MYSSVTSVIRCSEQRYTLPGYSFSNCRLCVVITTDEPDSQMLCNNSTMDLPVSTSRFPVGSSARIIAGELSTARAITMRCCSPPESSLGVYSPCWTFPRGRALPLFFPEFPVCSSSQWHEAQIPDCCKRYGPSAAESPETQFPAFFSTEGYACV